MNYQMGQTDRRTDGRIATFYSRVPGHMPRGRGTIAGQMVRDGTEAGACKNHGHALQQ